MAATQKQLNQPNNQSDRISADQAKAILDYINRPVDVKPERNFLYDYLLKYLLPYKHYIDAIGGGLRGLYKAISPTYRRSEGEIGYPITKVVAGDRVIDVVPGRDPFLYPRDDSYVQRYERLLRPLGHLSRFYFGFDPSQLYLASVGLDKPIRSRLSDLLLLPVRVAAVAKDSPFSGSMRNVDWGGLLVDLLKDRAKSILRNPSWPPIGNRASYGAFSSGYSKGMESEPNPFRLGLDIALNFIKPSIRYLVKFLPPSMQVALASPQIIEFIGRSFPHIWFDLYKKHFEKGGHNPLIDSLILTDIYLGLKNQISYPELHSLMHFKSPLTMYEYKLLEEFRKNPELIRENPDEYLRLLNKIRMHALLGEPVAIDLDDPRSGSAQQLKLYGARALARLLKQLYPDLPDPDRFSLEAFDTALRLQRLNNRLRNRIPNLPEYAVIPPPRPRLEIPHDPRMVKYWKAYQQPWVSAIGPYRKPVSAPRKLTPYDMGRKLIPPVKLPAQKPKLVPVVKRPDVLSPSTNSFISRLTENLVNRLLRWYAKKNLREKSSLEFSPDVFIQD